MKSTLKFFITLNKQTDEFILQEGTLISLKIPKNWQKPDISVKRPALWVCHLPANSLGIVYISLYPTELVIKKRNPEESSEKFEKELEEYEQDLENYGSTQKEENFLVYKGTLEPNGETEKETFFRCQLELQKKQEIQTKSQSSAVGVVFVFLIIFFVIIIMIGVMNKGGF